MYVMIFSFLYKCYILIVWTVIVNSSWKFLLPSSKFFPTILYNNDVVFFWNFSKVIFFSQKKHMYKWKAFDLENSGTFLLFDLRCYAYFRTITSLVNAPQNDWQIGHTKIFMRTSVHSPLEAKRTFLLQSSALLIQKVRNFFEII